MKAVAVIFCFLSLCSTLFATPPPISGCPPGMTTSGSYCMVFSFDFGQCFQTEDTLLFRIALGPGQIDSSTGLWLWNTASVNDTGSHVLVVAVRDANDSAGHETAATIVVIVTSSSVPDITSGCNTDVLLTNSTITAQMGTATACDDNAWFVSQFRGPVTGATCTIDNTGLINFATTVPGAYEYRVFVSNGVATDSCVHAFVVHGGTGCCVAGRGNVDGAGGVDLSDLSRLVAYMYSASTVLPCWDEANINGTGTIDLSDLSTLILFLTVPGGVTIVDCP